MKTKSAYRFISLEDPPLRELSMIMKEVAVEARESSRIAEQKFFHEITKRINKKRK